MNLGVGFTVIFRGAEKNRQRAAAGLERALKYFPNIHSLTLTIGETELTVWGHSRLEDSLHTLPDGSTLVCTGAPVVEKLSWDFADAHFRQSAEPTRLQIPWDGQVVLLHISADGSSWTLWNDWLGSIPVYYTCGAAMRVASTLEPVVVAANGFTADDFFLPGLLFLFMQGNTLADWTIFKGMQTIRPDSATTISDDGVRVTPYETICPSMESWELGWDELVDQMYALSREAITAALKTQPAWTLPLSSGLDSRLIAAVAAETHTPVEMYTWGPRNTRDVFYSAKIAEKLGFPWQRVDLGEDYLAHCLPEWVSLFGSAIHFHGMYQIPFIRMLQEKRALPVLSGFVGESLAGYDVGFMTRNFRPGQRFYNTVPADYQHWRIEELKALFRFSIDGAIEEIGDKIESEINQFSGLWFQKLRFLVLWGRQNHFTYFQSMLSSYACGVSTPYINRKYARFCVSLPRTALDDRRLQIDMMRRYYPRMMEIPGTYATEPAILTGTHFLIRRLAKHLPKPATQWLLPGYASLKRPNYDILSLRTVGEKALWPIPETTLEMRQWLHEEPLQKAYSDAVGGNINAVRKLQSVQTFAYRLNGHSNSD